MTVMKLKGPLGAALTPQHDDGSINLDGLTRHCQWLLENGCTGLALFGTTGEAECFSNNERIAALDHVVKTVDPSRIIVGVGRAAVADTITLARHAVGLGCAGVLALPPFYYKEVREDGLYRAYSQIIQSTSKNPFNLYLYHFPDMAGVGIEHALIHRLRRDFPDHIAGLKDSTGNFEGTVAFIGIGDGFDVFTGDDHLLGPAIESGAAGSITSTSNIAPHLLRAVYDGWLENSEESKRAHRMLTKIWLDGLLRYPVTEALKEFLAETTGAAGWLNMRAPLTRLTPEERASMFTTFDEVGFSILPSQKDTL